MPAKKKTTRKRPATRKTVATHTHQGAKRKNIPSAEMQPVVGDEVKTPVQVAYARRNPDLDPQFVWRGKDQGPLDVPAPPLYIQEKVHPKALIDDLLRTSHQSQATSHYHAPDLFADFNGLPDHAKSTGFYQHEGHWSNRMILGDSLQVMASLAEREGLHGKVQCIYLDPPYGIKFNSNFQWSTTSRDVKDGNKEHISREPEQVKAFRDTWRDGIHSYLTYLRDRLVVARDLLTESGSIFVQIGDENVHRVRAVMDEVFGEENFVALITVKKTSSSSGTLLSAVNDYLIWYGRHRDTLKYRQPYFTKEVGGTGGGQYKWGESPNGTRSSYRHADHLAQAPQGTRVFRPDNITSQRPSGGTDVASFQFEGKNYRPGKGTFKSDLPGLTKLS